MLVTNPIIQFVVYEWAKKACERVARRRGRALISIEFFLIGAFAKAVATVVTYPLQLAQSRLLNAKKKVSKIDVVEYTGTMDCLVQTLRMDGFTGLYRGMVAKLYQTVLVAAFQFMAYEKIIQLISRAMLSNKASH